MSFKQPRVPEYRESDGVSRYLRSLILFLKDFCCDVWTANRQRAAEIETLRREVDSLRSMIEKDGIDA